MKVINNHTQPLSLDGGVILGAAGTEGASKDVESLTDRDRRRYLDKRLIAVVEDAKPAAPAPTVDSDSTAIDKRRAK